MKTFKKMELLFQVTLAVTFAIITLIKGHSTLLVEYLVIGLLQSTSLLIHFVNRWHVTKGGRRYYYQHVLAFLLLFLGVASQFKSSYYSFLSIIAVPVMFNVLYVDLLYGSFPLREKAFGINLKNEL